MRPGRSEPGGLSRMDLSKQEYNRRFHGDALRSLVSGIKASFFINFFIHISRENIGVHIDCCA